MPEALAANLIQHITNCTNCAARLNSIVAEDLLVDAARANDPAPIRFEQEAVRRLVEKLRGLVHETKGMLADQTCDLPVPAAGAQTPHKPRTEPTAPAANDDGLAPPQGAGEIGRLGPYRVLKVLGEGGMGKVFLAEDPALQRQVALKVMKPSLACKGNYRERFLQEARAAAKIEHDNIIAIYQVGEDREVPFVAMPVLKGMSLEALLKREGTLRLKHTVRFGSQIARGLAAAHDRKLIHRDIKPANIWIEPNDGGRAKILDFGLARTTESEVGLTQAGVILGTPAYMPPEQARGETVDSRADLYSLGCVLYRMVAGELPLKSNSTMGMLTLLATQTPIAPHLQKPETPLALSNLIIKLLEKNPAKRFGSAREVVAALKSVEVDAAPGKSEKATSSQSAIEQDAAAPTAPVKPLAEAPSLFAFEEAARDERGANHTLAPSLATPRNRKPFLLAGLAALGVGLLAILVLGVIKITTADGDYVFQTDDTNFKLSLDKDVVVLEDKLKNRTYNLTSRPVKYTPRFSVLDCWPSSRPVGLGLAPGSDIGPRFETCASRFSNGTSSGVAGAG